MKLKIVSLSILMLMSTTAFAQKQPSKFQITMLKMFKWKKFGRYSTFRYFMHLQDTINYLKEETVLKQKKNFSLALAGGSGSSFALFHAAQYLKNKFNDQNLVKGVAILSGFDSFYNVLHALDGIEGLSEKELRKANRKLSRFHRKSREIGKMLIDDRFHYFNQEIVPRCEEYEKITDQNGFSYVGLLEQNFLKVRSSLEDIYRTAYPEKDFKGFESLLDYHKKVKISAHVQDLKTPLIFIQAKNDPLSIWKELEDDLMPQVKKNPLFQTVVTKHGGHGSFVWVYGEDWLFGKIQNFIEKLNLN